jgi:membrane associated rhomboid family serine protease
MNNLELGTLVIGLTAMFKKIGIPSNWLPVIAVILGTVIGVVPFIYSPYQAIIQAAAQGALTGLCATGLVAAVDGRLEKTQMIVGDLPEDKELAVTPKQE